MLECINFRNKINRAKNERFSKNVLKRNDPALNERVDNKKSK